MNIVAIAIPIPLRKCFYYLAPCTDTGDDIALSEGMRVLVPFGNKKLVGICIDNNVLMAESKDSQRGEGNAEYITVDNTVDNTADNAVQNLNIEKLKKIESVLDEFPALDQHQLKIAKWLSEYYLHPIGEVLASMLPAKLRKKTALEELSSTYLLASENVKHSANLELRSSKQKKLMNLLETSKMTKQQVGTSFSASVVKALLDKKLIEQKSFPRERRNWQGDIALSEKHKPNVEQALAIATINEASAFNCFLLDGITGSGKTEVYLQVIENVLLKGGQILILVPEIGLTPQTVARFEQRFGPVVASIHSGLSDTQRLEVWHQARRGDVGIVIGTRSSIFLPFKHLSMIIVDEEHDDSFKQQDGLRYNARDLAVYRAKLLNIPLVMGSATPSLESLHNAQTRKYRYLSLSKRAGNANLPSQHLLNISAAQLNAGLAFGLLEKIRNELENGHQVLLFVNRRGFAPSLICHQCGHVESCNGCDGPMTVHKTSRNLQCHRCGDYQPLLNRCRVCGSNDLSTEGIGTEQLEEYLKQVFPDYSSVRIDSDSTRSKQRLSEILASINRNEYQLLIGTQILSKGHHFPNVTLAIVVNVDSLLFSADFRASEKMGQLITQLSGRAGRANAPGEVWLQTHQPAHPVLQDLVQNGYQDFAKTLLAERKQASLPPYSFQILLRAESEQEDKVLEFLQFAAAMLKQFRHAKTIGPLPCLIEKKQGRFRHQVILQSQSRKYAQTALGKALEQLQQHKLSSRIRWFVDVQPQDFS